MRLEVSYYSDPRIEVAENIAQTSDSLTTRPVKTLSKVVKYVNKN